MKCHALNFSVRIKMVKLNGMEMLSTGDYGTFVISSTYIVLVMNGGVEWTKGPSAPNGSGDKEITT